MPNIKSAMKRDEKSKELKAKNRADKTELKTAIKKFDTAVAEGTKMQPSRPIRLQSSPLITQLPRV